jgi:hypothetical protein
MKYDKSLIGEKVINLSNNEGIITNVDKNGNITIKFQGDYKDGTFLFDPFLSGHVRFVNAKNQDIIDSEIEKIRAEKLYIVKSSIASIKNEETYYITKDNVDGTKEVVYSLKCDLEQACIVFGFVVQEQQKEYRSSNFKTPWRVVRLFESKSNKQIRQES